MSQAQKKMSELKRKLDSFRDEMMETSSQIRDDEVKRLEKAFNDKSGRMNAGHNHIENGLAGLEKKLAADAIKMDELILVKERYNRLEEEINILKADRDRVLATNKRLSDLNNTFEKDLVAAREELESRKNSDKAKLQARVKALDKAKAEIEALEEDKDTSSSVILKENFGITAKFNKPSSFATTPITNSTSKNSSPSSPSFFKYRTSLKRKKLRYSHFMTESEDDMNA